ncbi:hypothetical protein ITJ57_16975 [Plantibacter sp. VKM Ac-2880]|uniref:hypothetical protein n=1 Tax=Plantibacter sp. VKM Ac-2880 TaxID=2783827 RepID=UPI00188E8282|nr:hypothetical protein [Plantibacter sp. VKM Ac-2880]MBF4570462.1 hypothetical protein [Plantibacter sp. VKM Ac-2880]
MHDTTTPPPAAPARGRTALAALAMAVPAIAIAITRLVWGDALPVDVASHWSGTGAPDDSQPAAGVFVVTLIIASVAAIAAIILLALPRPARRTKRMIVLILGIAAGSAAAVWVIPTWLTIQAGSVDGAVLGWWIVPLAACSLWGVIPAAILPAQPLLAGATARPAPMDLGETEVGAWSRSVTALLFLWLTLALVAIGAVAYTPILLGGESGVATLGLSILTLATLLCASFIRLRVSVDWRGLRVVSLFGIPMKRIPLDQVDVVEATDIRPMDWGGWGYRIMPGRSAVVLRSGPGLVVTTASGKQFAITIDDPEEPAALLQALVARAAARV